MLSQTKFRENYTFYARAPWPRCWQGTVLWCRYSSVPFGDRTRPQNLNWTTFYATSAEFGHFTSPSQPQARHEPSSSQAQMLLFFCFLFEFHGHWKAKHFYINCRNNLKGTIKYLIRNYVLRSWCGKALVEELMIICFAGYCHLINSGSWNEMTKLLKQRSDRNNNCTRPGARFSKVPVT